MDAEVVAEDLGFAEGPVSCPGGWIAVTSVDRGLLYRVLPDQHRAEVLATTGGGPNGAALAAGGALVVTQNGGFDFSHVPEVPDPAPVRPATPGLQLVDGDGSVTYLLDTGFQAPNDLAAAPDGRLYLTDPPRFPPAPGRHGRLWCIEPDGRARVVGEPYRFCNGIAVDRDGRLVVVEGRGLISADPGGEREVLVEDLGPGGADGLCLDEQGRLYVAATTEHAVRVIEDGRQVDLLSLDGPGLTTNCCFGGPDRRTLFATDGVPGRLVAWESMPTPGLALPAWRPPPRAVVAP